MSKQKFKENKSPNADKKKHKEVNRAKPETALRGGFGDLSKLLKAEIAKTPLDLADETESRKAQLELQEFKEIIEMRRKWGRWMMGIVIAILIFEIALTIAVGLEALVFNDEWFLRIIVLGGISEIIALPIIVVNFLFSNNSQKPTVRA